MQCKKLISNFSLYKEEFAPIIYRYIDNFSNIITRETSFSCVRLSLLYSISHGYGQDMNFN